MPARVPVSAAGESELLKRAETASALPKPGAPLQVMELSETHVWTGQTVAPIRTFAPRSLRPKPRPETVTVNAPDGAPAGLATCVTNGASYVNKRNPVEVCWPSVWISRAVTAVEVPTAA